MAFFEILVILLYLSSSLEKQLYSCLHLFRLVILNLVLFCLFLLVTSLVTRLSEGGLGSDLVEIIYHRSH